MRNVLLLTATASLAGVLSACEVKEAEKYGDPKFPLVDHSLLPLYGPNTGQIATGIVYGEALEQPIMFSHVVHAGEDGIACQYCHSEARKSIHAGVPALEVCMGCHRYVKTDSPEVQKIHQAWCGKPSCTVAEDEFGRFVPDPAGKPIAWNKVHDLPDFVHFNHSRHIQGGVDCTECHGQVQLQGKYERVPIPGGAAGATYRQVDSVMVREAPLQMGWCLDCHASHPKIDENYGDKADLRRAELKDCWTCHK
jgi:hypothetical protein